MALGSYTSYLGDMTDRLLLDESVEVGQPTEVMSDDL